MLCILFLMHGVPPYVRHYTRIDAISDELPFLPLQWFQLIIANRPTNGENVAQLSDINDIRNGVFSNNSIHTAFDARDVVILRVCRLTPPLFR